MADLNGIRFERLGFDCLETYIALRIRQLREEGADEDIDIVPALRDYYRRHMADGTFAAWIALDGEKVVATSGMSFVEKPPYFSCPNGRIGLLSGMYTDKAYRRRGIARELLLRVVRDAEEHGCCLVQVTASEAGVPLYLDFGFVKHERFLQYTLEIPG